MQFAPLFSYCNPDHVLHACRNRSNVVYFSVDLHGQYVEAAKKLVEEHIQLAEHTVRTTQGMACHLICV